MQRTRHTTREREERDTRDIGVMVEVVEGLVQRKQNIFCQTRQRNFDEKEK